MPLVIRKVKRTTPLQVQPIAFPSFAKVDLHLGLLEVKNKLKPTIPKIVITPKTKIVISQPDPEPESAPPPKTLENQATDEQPLEDKMPEPIPEEEDELAKELGEDPPEPEEEPRVEEPNQTDTPQEPTSTDESLPPDELEKKQKKDLIWKLHTMKRKYPDANLVDYDDTYELADMKDAYETTVKKIELDSNIETYQRWLVYGFAGIEYVMCQLIGIDMRGLTQFQGEKMNDYRALLVEIGEKPYAKIGQNLPVEAKLLLTMMFNTAAFYFFKNAAKHMGFVFDIIKNLSNNAVRGTSTAEATPAPSKKKMRGPTVAAEDLQE
jgi:hypothetical protein